MSGVSQAGNMLVKAKLPRPDKNEACPRCSSSGHTKFCYYKNSNPKQPRFFCMACQRYWTSSGTLRNVPADAGRHKSQHTRTAGDAPAPAAAAAPAPAPPVASKNAGSTSNINAPGNYNPTSRMLPPASSAMLAAQALAGGFDAAGGTAAAATASVLMPCPALSGGSGFGDVAAHARGCAKNAKVWQNKAAATEQAAGVTPAGAGASPAGAPTAETETAAASPEAASTAAGAGTSATQQQQQVLACSNGSCPLLQLDPHSQGVLMALLRTDDKNSLRLVCKAMPPLVDSWAQWLSVDCEQLRDVGSQLQQRYPVLSQLTVTQCDDADETLLAKAAEWSTITCLAFEQCSLESAARMVKLFPGTVKLSCSSGWMDQVYLEGCAPRGLALGAPLLVSISQVLPRLTSLKLAYRSPVGHAELQALAALPALSVLELNKLTLSQACCEAPLLALTRLSVLSCTEAAGVQYSAVFPALQALTLRTRNAAPAAAADTDANAGAHAAAMGGSVPWVGLTDLTSLELGGRDMHEPRMKLAAEDFEALAQLPQLSMLSLDEDDVSRQRVTLLTQLQGVAWTHTQAEWREMMAEMTACMLLYG